MSFSLGSPSSVARVRWVSDDGLQLYVDFRSGLTGTVGLPEPVGVVVGSVLLVRQDGIELAPEELWPADSWVGVVRKPLGDTALVAGRGDVRLVDVNGVPCEEGNTVEVEDAVGIVRVLHDAPISYLEAPELGDNVIGRFRRADDARDLTFDDFGGLRGVKRRAYELVELPLERHAALAAIGARPIKGVLFTGKPGTGKTMLARIIASRARATFYEISGPQIFSKWLGESEAVLRGVFADAAKQDRSIIFFDEIDSVAPQRASEAHEASRRVVAQLLTQMDGFTPETNVVVIAATNRPGDIDSALRRPGRFDWEIDFPLPTLADRVEILTVSARGLKTTDSLPHDDVAQRTDRWSSAELAAIWSEAALLAVADGRDSIMDEDYYGGYERVATQRERLLGAQAQPPER